MNGITTIPRTVEIYNNGLKIDEHKIVDDQPDSPYEAYQQLINMYIESGFTSVTSSVGDDDYDVLFDEKSKKSVCISMRIRFDVKDIDGHYIYTNSVLQVAKEFEHMYPEDNKEYMIHQGVFDESYYFENIHTKFMQFERIPIESLDDLSHMRVIR